MAFYTTDNDKINEDIARRKEFIIRENPDKIITKKSKKINQIESKLNLSAAQAYIQNLMSPNTPYPRMLVKWQTGVGKTIAALSIYSEYLKQWKYRLELGDTVPYTYILGFNALERFQDDLIRYEEFGFVSNQERKALIALRQDPAKIKQYAAHLGIIRRKFKIIGRIKFYGYRAFSNALFKVKNGVDLDELLSTRCDTLDGCSDNTELALAVKRGDVIINEVLLNDLKRGLLICDEIHNAYNSVEANNYGLAIQYALDHLERMNADPRVVCLSATPLTGNASEVVDLLNIIVPTRERPNNELLRRSNYFTKRGLKPGAIDEIARLSKGRVSFLLDTNESEYPRQEILGETIKGVPYVKLELCEISELQRKTIDADVNPEVGLGPLYYTLYDMVFPNKNDPNKGLYRTQDLNIANGIEVDRDGKITGSFLQRENIGKYSGKYLKFLERLEMILESGDPGKILVYHNNVKASGVLLLSELLSLDGYLEINGVASTTTRCVRCGRRKKIHTAKEECQFMPARFMIAHGSIDRSDMANELAQFNDIENRLGESLKICIGSRVIKEGLNFTCVRYQIILSLPVDFPTLIQVLGRAVRKHSHEHLDYTQRNVKVWILVSSYDGGGPEIRRYLTKGWDFLVIQETEKPLNAGAVDKFMNYAKISNNFNTIKAIPYDGPPQYVKSRDDIISYTNDAYEFESREIQRTKMNIIYLFTGQSVWTYDDLWKMIRDGEIPHSFEIIDESTFALALHELSSSEEVISKEQTIVCTGKYYVRTFIKQKMIKNSTFIDINSHLRPNELNNISVQLSEFNKNSRSDRVFSIQIAKLNSIMERGDPTVFLVEFSQEFHIDLLKKLIMSKKTGEKITSHDEVIISVYDRFKILIRYDDLSDLPTIQQQVNGEIVGFTGPSLVELYNSEKNVWFSVSTSEFGLRTNFEENDIVIGFMAPVGHKAEIGNDKFKIREPMQKLKKIAQMNKKDSRSVAQGSTCETKPKAELLLIIEKLRKHMKIKGKYAGRKYCNEVSRLLLILEENARNSGSGIKWLYLFCDKQPSLVSIA